MRIWNADGGEVGACGNGARCVGWLLMEAAGRDEAAIETAAGLIEARRAGERAVTLDMGEPGLGWRDIPLAREMDTRQIALTVDPGVESPGCVSMGNPHVVFFVADAEAAPAARVGPMVEHDPLFPERANVGFAQIKAADRIRLRVWERGAGLTRACGTGACAALVAAHRRKLAGRKVTVELDGGELAIEWRAERRPRADDRAGGGGVHRPPADDRGPRMNAPVDVVTFGCRLNACESQAIREQAAMDGITDAVVFNTCAVTAEAVRQARQAIRKARRERPGARLIVTGCAAQIDPAAFAAMAEVDLVLGNAEKAAPGAF